MVYRPKLPVLPPTLCVLARCTRVGLDAPVTSFESHRAAEYTPGSPSCIPEKKHERVSDIRARRSTRGAHIWTYALLFLVSKMGTKRGGQCRRQTSHGQKPGVAALQLYRSLDTRLTGQNNMSIFFEYAWTRFTSHFPPRRKSITCPPSSGIAVGVWIGF